MTVYVDTGEALLFSLVIRYSLNNKAAPVVFIQYLLSLAIVEAVRKKHIYEVWYFMWRELVKKKELNA